MSHKTAFIALEGSDMSGKTTQTKLLSKSFSDAGFVCRAIKVPFDDKVTHKLIYSMLFSGAAKKYPALFQAVQFCNKLICQASVMFAKEDVIIFDRWHMSSIVYGTASGLSQSLLDLLSKLLITPDLTLILMRSDSQKFLRDEKQDSYEKDSALQRRVEELYKSYCDNKRVISVSADGTISEVTARIKAVINSATSMYLPI